VGNAALDVHAMKPRPRTIGIASEVHERPPIQKDRMTHAPIVDVIRSVVPPAEDAPDVQFVGRGA
jgi:hypothetical protein